MLDLTDLNYHILIIQSLMKGQNGQVTIEDVNEAYKETPEKSSTIRRMFRRSTFGAQTNTT